MNRRTTPNFIDTLKENEIFVFGCRKSGRHIDGASAFAFEHFGAIMGQNEGRQGQSYAIPTVGGSIRLSDIRRSINKFINYASMHPELHFFVTPIGCGGGGWSPSQIAPLFSGVSKLDNISLPENFWNELNKSIFTRCREWWYKKKQSFRHKKYRLEKTCLITILEIMPPSVLYRLIPSSNLMNILSLVEYDLMEGMAVINPRITVCHPDHLDWIVNHNTKRTYILRDFKGRFRFKDTDIDWKGTKDLPEKVQNRIHNRETPFWSSGVRCPGYHNSVACVFWTVSPDGKTYYLDKWYGGFQTNEENVTLYGFIDTECKVVVKMEVVPDEKREDFIIDNGMRFR